MIDVFAPLYADEEPREGLEVGALVDPDLHLEPSSLEGEIAALHEEGSVIARAGRDLSELDDTEIVWPSEADPFWLVVGHDAIQEASRNDKLSSAERGVFLFDVQDSLTLATIEGRFLLHTDADDHQELRSTFMQAFRERDVFRMYDALRESADVIIADALNQEGSFDVVEHLAAPLPLEVVGDMLGLDTDKRDRMATIARLLSLYDDQRFTSDLNTALIHAGELLDMSREHYQAEIEHLREGVEEGDETVMTRLAEAASTPESKVSAEDLDAFFLLLAVAGTETTSTVIARSLMALHENPEQLEYLIENRGDGDIIENAIREFLRYTSPVAMFRRTATEDTEIDGQPVAAGDKVILSYLGANRDPNVFRDIDPATFDVTRSFDGISDITFGWGAHRCLGARLAEQEIRAFFSAYFDALADRNVRLSIGEPNYGRSSFVRSIVELPATVVKAA